MSKAKNTKTTKSAKQTKLEKSAEQTKFELDCYHAYQLDWMMSHGFTIDDVMDQLKASLIDQVESDNEVIDSGRKMDNFMQCAKEEFLMEQGFGNGTIYACLDEFLDHEYQDPRYMKHLLRNLPNADEMMQQYARYTQKPLSYIPDLQVKTTAGMLNAYRSGCESDAIAILLQPEGFEQDGGEIDICMAEVLTSKDLMEYHGIGEQDVSVVIWGGTDEDYTDKQVIKRDTIEARCEECLGMVADFYNQGISYHDPQVERARSKKLDKMLGQRVRAELKLPGETKQIVTGRIGFRAGFLVPSEYFILTDDDMIWHFKKSNIVNIKLL